MDEKELLKLKDIFSSPETYDAIKWALNSFYPKSKEDDERIKTVSQKFFFKTRTLKVPDKERSLFIKFLREHNVELCSLTPTYVELKSINIDEFKTMLNEAIDVNILEANYSMKAKRELYEQKINEQKIASFKLKIQHFPNEISDKEWLEFFELDAKNIQYIPANKQTEYMVEQCFQKVIGIEHILITPNPDFVLASIKNNSYLLNYIKFEWLNYEAYKYIVTIDRYLEHTPQEFLTAEIVRESLKHHPWSIHEIIKFNLFDLLTEEDFMEMVINKPPTVQYIPFSFQTKELWLKAIEKDSELIQHIPYDFCTTEIAESVVKRYPKNYRYIRDSFKTEELSILAISEFPENIKYLPEEFINQEFLLKNLHDEAYSDTNVIRFVLGRLDLLSDEMIFKLSNARSSFYALQCIFEFQKLVEFVSEELLTNIVKNCWVALERIPMEYQTYNMCLEALKQESLGAVKYIKLTTKPE